MSNKDHKTHIENVINRTFEIIKDVYSNQQEKNDQNDSRKKTESRILFPRNCNNKDGKEKIETRVSEQELRFIFVEQLNKEIGEDGENWDVYYSVETPTKGDYLFKEDYPRQEDKDGQSANFDLVIHDSNFRRIALIEFKANNPDIHDYQKDIVKLTNEDEKGALRYFIQILENTQEGSKRNTLKSIEEKTNPQQDSNWKEKWGSEEVGYRCYSLERGKRSFSTEDIIEESLKK